MDSRPADNLRGSRTKVNNKAFSPGTIKGLNLRDRLELDRPSSSSSASHHNMRKQDDDSQSTSKDHSENSKLKTKRVNSSDNDELVKHMWNLPSFLERGVKSQEKAFSVGVLDWGLLEKWQSGKQVPYRSDRSSSSNSMSSLFSTEGSSTSTHTRAGHISSGAHHEDHVSMVQFQNEGFLSETHSAGAKSSQNVGKTQLAPKLISNMKEGCGSNASSSVTFCSPNHHLASYSNPQMKSSLVESEKEVRKSRRSKSMSLDQQSAERDKKALHVPSQDIFTGVSVAKGLKMSSGKTSSEENQRSCTSRPREVQYAELSCDIPRSCPLSCDVNERLPRSCRTNESASTGGRKQHSAQKPVSSSKAKESDDVKLYPTVIDLLQVSRTKITSDATGTRYPSSTGRFNFGIHTVSRKPNSKDAEMAQGCTTAQTTAKSGEETEICHSSIDNTYEKPDAALKARSSPLKRLLVPLLKSKEPNSRRASESLIRETTSVDRVSKTLDRPSTAPGIRLGSIMSSQKSASIYKSHQNWKDSGSSVVQALLQVVVQNDCPVFTFAVDGVKDLLCAALSKVSSPKKFEDSYLYTFFSVHELKSKGWINLRGKSTSHPSVLAQMEVSETLFTNVGERQVFENRFLRNFVLSSVKLIQGEKKDTQYQIQEELAAVVVNISGLAGDKLQTDKFNGINTTIILPSGSHTLPIKGKPSSLIERWRSGGACDCGGWDSGCKLRILTDSKCQSSCFGASKFQLYEQGVADEKQSIFNLAPYKEKDGVLAVSFSSSVSPLQAFSICIAVLDSRKQSTLLRPNYTPKEKPTAEESTTQRPQTEFK